MERRVKTVLWLSRHKPLPSQIEYLKDRLGDFKLFLHQEPIPTVNHALKLVERYKADYVIPVLPLSFTIRLVEKAGKAGFKVLRADMQLLHNCSTGKCPDFNSETDTIVVSTDFETGEKIYRHYRFVSFKLLKDVVFVEEDW